RWMTLLRQSLRARVPFVALALGTIALGIWVHLYGRGLGAPRRDVLGDVLWAMMIAWWVGALAPSAPLRVRGAAALAICVGVELSQPVHTPPPEAMGGTSVGARG